MQNVIQSNMLIKTTHWKRKNMSIQVVFIWRLLTCIKSMKWFSKYDFYLQGGLYEEAVFNTGLTVSSSKVYTYITSSIKYFYLSFIPFFPMLCNIFIIFFLFLIKKIRLHCQIVMHGKEFRCAIM